MRDALVGQAPDRQRGAENAHCSKAELAKATNACTQTLEDAGDGADDRGGAADEARQSGADFSVSVGVIQGVGGVARKSSVKRCALGIFLKARFVLTWNRPESAARV